jgi:hypothetical protein
VKRPPRIRDTERNPSAKIKLGHRQQRILQRLLNDPEYAQHLHEPESRRKVEMLITMGYLDESWQVTDTGKAILGRAA